MGIVIVQHMPKAFTGRSPQGSTPFARSGFGRAGPDKVEAGTAIIAPGGGPHGDFPSGGDGR